MKDQSSLQCHEGTTGRKFWSQRFLELFPGSPNVTQLSSHLHLCKNHTHIDLQYEKRLCQRLRQGLVRLLNSAFSCSWSCPARSSLGSDAAQTPNLNVLNTLSTLDCSFSCSKCLLFFPVWIQLKLQDICQTG